MSEPRDLSATASTLLRVLPGLLIISILIQFFIAGMSSLTALKIIAYVRTLDK